MNQARKPKTVLFACVLIVNALLGLASFGSMLALTPELQWGFAHFAALVTGVALACGVLILLGKRGALWPGVLFFAIQTFGFHSPDLTLAFTSGLHLNIYLHFTAADFVVNFLAIAFMLLGIAALDESPVPVNPGTGSDASPSH